MKKIYILINGTKIEKDNFIKKFLNEAKEIKLLENLSNVLDAFNAFEQIVINSNLIDFEQRAKIYTALNTIKPKIILVDFENDNSVSLKEPVAEIWKISNNEIEEKLQKILIASTNIGKINIYTEIFNELNLPVTSLAEVKVEETVNETGLNEIENAILKAEAYHKITGLPVFANDSGLIIDKFKPEDQPGVLVRRFGGRELTDQEMLQIYIEKLNKVGGESEGHYNVGLALIDKNGKLYTREFKPYRYFINKPSKVLKKGVPLSSICYDKESGLYESEMTIKQRNIYEKAEMSKQKDFIKEHFIK